MSSSTTATATATQACSTADWCTSHAEVPDCPGIFVHLSDFDVSSRGTVTALKVYTWSDGTPMTGHASLLVFTPLPGAPTTPEAWRLEWLRSIAAA
jgi:hypothetical protein